MLRSTRYAMAVMLVLELVAATTPAGEARSVGRTIKGSENPDAIPYVEAVRAYVSGLDSGDAADLRRVQDDIDRTMDDATTKRFVDHMASALERHSAASRDEMSGMCARRVEFVALRQIAEAMVEIQERADRSFELDIRDAKSILGDRRMDRFDRHINTEVKRSMGHAPFDMEREIESTVETPAEKMAFICDREPLPAVSRKLTPEEAEELDRRARDR